MKTRQLEKIVEDLINEWKYLLVAAETWEWLHVHQQADTRGVPMHTVVMAMDSAFLHGRNLYEFFGRSGKLKGYRRPNTMHAFGIEKDDLKSPWWDTWEQTLHARLFHLRANRSKVQGKDGPFRRTAINGEIIAMRDGLRNLWGAFLKRVSDAGDRAALELAMRSARHDLDTGDVMGRLQEIEARILR
jgi:hypothetical protein